MKGVITSHDNEVEEINFSDVYLEEHKFQIQPYPASLLPEEPAGQLDAIMQMGQSLPQLASRLPMALEGIPDFRRIVGSVTGPIRIAEKMVGNILDGKGYVAPIPSMNLDEALRIGIEAQLDAFVDDIPESRRQLLRRWVAQVQDLKMKAQEAAMMQAAPQPGAPTQPAGPSGLQPTLAGPPQPAAGPPNIQ